MTRSRKKKRRKEEMRMGKSRRFDNLDGWVQKGALRSVSRQASLQLRLHSVPRTNTLVIKGCSIHPIPFSYIQVMGCISGIDAHTVGLYQLNNINRIVTFRPVPSLIPPFLANVDDSAFK